MSDEKSTKWFRICTRLIYRSTKKNLSKQLFVSISSRARIFINEYRSTWVNKLINKTLIERVQSHSRFDSLTWYAIETNIATDERIANDFEKCFVNDKKWNKKIEAYTILMQTIKWNKTINLSICVKLPSSFSRESFINPGTKRFASYMYSY